MNKIFTQRWIWLVVVLAVLWVSAEVRNWQLRHRLASLWARTVAINVIDDSSGTHLTCSIGGIPALDSNHDYLPWVTVGGLDTEIPSVTVASDKPLTLQIASEGYQEQPVTIDQSTSSEVIVRLKKK
jgi:hypothetical protein